jgi:hypothetical protein
MEITNKLRKSYKGKRKRCIFQSNNGSHHCRTSPRSARIFSRQFFGRMIHNNSQSQLLYLLSRGPHINLLQIWLSPKDRTTKIWKNKLGWKTAELIVPSMIAENFFTLNEKYLLSFYYINVYLLIYLISAKALIFSNWT